jgi:hypothetical protein
MGSRTARDGAFREIPTWLAEEMIETRVWPKTAGFDNSEVTPRERVLLENLIRDRRKSETLSAQVDSL